MRHLSGLLALVGLVACGEAPTPEEPRQALETRAVETSTVETSTVETSTVETSTVETSTVETSTVETSTVETVPAAPPERLVIEASGDLVLNALAMRAIRAAPTEREGYHVLLDGYARALVPEGLTYLNLEMPLVDDRRELDSGWPRSRTERPRRAPVLGASPALAGVLAELGVELVGLANNHALDQGEGGLAATEQALDAASLVHAGTGATREDAYAPAWIERAGFRIAFFSATEPLNQRASDGPRRMIARLDPEEPLLERVREARAEADLVIVAVHWSTDFVMAVTGSQRALGQELVEAGADLVLGTGPHVLQTVERLTSPRGDAVIAYSLGNLASGMGRAYRFGEIPERYIHPANVLPEARDGVVLHLRIERGERLTITAENRLLFTESDWLVARDHAPAHLAVRPLGEMPAACADRLPIMAGALGAAVTLVPSTCSAR